MADTITVEVDPEVHARLSALAAARGLDLPGYLAELAGAPAARQGGAGLDRAARAFEAAVERPGFREGFARDFRAAGSPGR
ncbi:antitoxin MazE7 [Streptomyces sp. cmx-4-9]|uniref:antitoxin MazE7 n=1 Tax=Streptomyces sp. cmx-4-9 TaxID=2790941 RepID=UPI003980082F